MNHTGVTSLGCARHAFRKRQSLGAGDNRGLARLGRCDEDRVSLELHAVDPDWQRGRAGEHLSGLEREDALVPRAGDRKSTRLNSSHDQISYAVFCLKKKTEAKQSKRTGRPYALLLLDLS